MIREVIYFHKNNNDPSDGEILKVPRNTQVNCNITVDVSPKSVSGIQVAFEGLAMPYEDAEYWFPISLFCAEDATLSVVAQKSGIYQGDLSGIEKFRCRLIAANAPINVVGKVVT